MQTSDLAGCVASRICHDLVSPVGAVVNGVDLVRDMRGADTAEAIGMIGQSAERASALLQFYRLAFGAADPGAAPIARAALAELTGVLTQPPRITLDWEAREGPPLPRPEARLLMLLLLCARSVTGMRGAIRLWTHAGAALPLTLSVEGEAFAATAGMLDLLAGAAPPEPVTPRTVEFALALRTAEALRVRLAVERGEGRIAILADPVA